MGLTVADIESITATVPGGARNIQDIYPLAPLQEGILFHHLLARDGDPYLTRVKYRFASRARLDAFLAALQAVIDRHDILRTAVLWEDLPEPVQVVWRQARLVVEEVALDPAGGAAVEQLFARFDPRQFRLDVCMAPLLRAAIAHDPVDDRWVMVLLLHHLASDHSTIDGLNREIEAFQFGQLSQLPSPPPFRNFVAQGRLGMSREEHEAFFRELLGDVDEPTAPFGLADVHGDGSGIVEARRPVDAALAQRLRARSRALDVSAASIVHLAFARVLGAVSARDDVVFGTVLVGRMQGGDEAAQTLGLFINTLPVRIRLDDGGVQEGVRRTHALLAQLLHHEHASLALAQRCSAVAAPAPLFSALLNYRHSVPKAKRSEAESRAWDGIELLGAEERTNYPFTVSVDDLGAGFGLVAQVPGSLDPRRVCDLMHTALASVVTALEHTPNLPVHQLDVLPDAERHQLLVGWNDTARPYPSDRCIHELFEAQVTASPQAVAVVHEDAQLSYVELDARANRLARFLRARGVRPDTRVALCVERSLEMVVGLLAVLKAGGAYVPLDPSYPAERLRYMFEDSAPAVVLTHAAVPAAVRELLRSDGVPLIDLQADAAQWAAEPASDLERGRLTSDHLAYVIYTSGSTGRPKGVMIEHRGVVNVLAWMQDAYRLSPADVVLQKAPFGFDFSVWELFWPLLYGAELVMARAGGQKDPSYLSAVIEDRGVTTLHFVPSMMPAFIEDDGAGPCSSVKRVISGGEALPGAIARRFRERFPHIELHNLYGPTETTVHASTYPCTAETLPANIPIGRPITNTRLYILGRRDELVPIGVTGELHIGGVQVGRGYLNRPDLTAERFIANPFVAGDRLYRTGDLARYLPDGEIEFLGRTDFQVKIRGFRIELGEIEAHLAQHPAVDEVAVLAREDIPGEKQLVAYYTRAGAAPEASAESLRAYAQEALPEYMVPAAYVELDALPLTPNGKLDRKALPAPQGGSYAARAYEPPSGEAECAIARIWTDLLGLERVGRHDNFFELGGYSLLVVQAIGRMRGAGLHADVRAFFTTSTLAELAAVVTGESATVTVPPNLIPAASEVIVPEMLTLWD